MIPWFASPPIESVEGQGRERHRGDRATGAVEFWD